MARPTVQGRTRTPPGVAEEGEAVARGGPDHVMRQGLEGGHEDGEPGAGRAGPGVSRGEKEDTPRVEEIWGGPVRTFRAEEGTATDAVTRQGTTPGYAQMKVIT